MDKVISLAEAAALVRSGDTLALGGMTLYRRPVAFVRELLKTDARDLALLCFTASYESDLLVGAGRVSTIRSCYFGLEAFGLAPMFTALATRGDVRVVEESEGSLAFGIRATLAGVGFMPGPGWIGTDMLKVRPDVKVIDDPYTGRPVAAFPAVTCDVAVIHTPLADRYGNARLGGNLAMDRDLSMIARHVILTAEEIVDALDAPVDVGQTFTTAVVSAPRGAWPSSCYPLYAVDGAEILRYIDACAAGKFEAYLREMIGPAG
ncbi:MAG TPA: CoA-transferase [Anaerolineae bacterium]|nr:CoA-transferase [Anaerolineae bacterium]